MSAVTQAKKKKKAKKENLFDSKTLKCLVCKSLVEEIEAEIFKVDPSKKVEVGTFRLTPDGSTQRQTKPYARSQEHLMEMVDNICKNFEDYAQVLFFFHSDQNLKIIELINNIEGKLLDLIQTDFRTTKLIDQKYKIANETQSVLYQEHFDELKERLITLENPFVLNQVIFLLYY
jgi:hypothetical protein